MVLACNHEMTELVREAIAGWCREGQMLHNLCCKAEGCGKKLVPKRPTADYQIKPSEKTPVYYCRNVRDDRKTQCSHVICHDCYTNQLNKEDNKRNETGTNHRWSGRRNRGG